MFIGAIKKPVLTLPILIFLIFAVKSEAYDKDYPPYKFKVGPFKSLQSKPLVDYDHSEYKSSDGKVVVRLIEKDSESFDFDIKEDNNIVFKKNIRDTPFPYEVYREDVDGNNLKDFIVFSSYRMNGFSSWGLRVEIFLRKKEGGYQRIAYDGAYVGMEDFVDFNKDGKYEVIISGIYSGREHTYYSYDIYEFEDYKLVNADSKYKGFPKFVWFTNEPNDKDTIHLTSKERKVHVEEKNRSLTYEVVPSKSTVSVVRH